jgi:hypothetical protein
MKEISKKKQWKFNKVVKDLHTPKYHQRVKQSKQKYESEEESIEEGLEDYHLNKGESSTP